MDETTFWDLIDHTKKASAGDGYQQAKLLIQELLNLASDDICSYYEILTQQMDRAYSNDLWAVAYIINCGCSDDGFSDFRAWLIGQGKEIFEATLQDPVSLINLVSLSTVTQIEELGPYAPLYAYEEKTGHIMPSISREPPILSGEEWEEEDLHRKYPQLWAKFGDCSQILGST